MSNARGNVITNRNRTGDEVQGIGDGADMTEEVADGQRRGIGCRLEP